MGAAYAVVAWLLVQVADASKGQTMLTPANLTHQLFALVGLQFWHGRRRGAQWSN